MRACGIDGCSRRHYARGMCNPHYQVWRRDYDGPQLSNRPYEVRFWEKVDKDGTVPVHRPELGPCWPFTGGVGSGGYGVFDRPSKLAHRVAYELLVGPIPEATGDGQVVELDHLCRVRNCVNPEHLEPVTKRVNQRRGFSVSGLNAAKTHCDSGHLFDETNTRVVASGPRKGKRECRACGRERKRMGRSRKRAA